MVGNREYRKLKNFLEEFDNFISSHWNLKKILEYVKSKQGSHGGEHLIRTARYAYAIGKMNKLDEKELELLAIASFLHDIERNRELMENPKQSAEKAKEIMESFGYTEGEIIIVTRAILFHPSGNSERLFDRILYDADKLDLVGRRALIKRVPQYAEELGVPEEDILEYGFRKLRGLEFKTPIGRELALRKLEYACNLYPEVVEKYRSEIERFRVRNKKAD